MPVIEITSDAQFKEIIAEDKISIFDFWAQWCGPCRMISPVFERISNEITSVDFYKVDFDKFEDLSTEVGIRAMPTFVVYKGGKKLGETVGANPGALETLIKTHAT